ncbi:MAG: YaiO family outer membrane beta-barrel protein [Flavobacteriaceae bacterium]
MKRKVFIILFQCFACSVGYGQEVSYSGDPDMSYYAARELAFAGQHIIARDTLKQILSRYPDYTDVRNLLAKTYSWDANYNEARKHLNRITSVERQNSEAWIAAIKNEIYAKNPQIALGLTNKALLYLQDDAELLALKERLTKELNQTKDAESVDDNSSAEKDEEAKPRANQMAIFNAFDVFDVVYEPMIYSGVEYTRITDAGKIIPRINYANRFDTHGLQYELDFYPVLSKTFYGYLNYGYSAADIFPSHRLGVELFSNLPKGKEASLGIRYMDFLDTKTTIFTGSFGLYKGNYYVSIRPYVTPNPEGSTGVSGSLTARKYLKTKEQYMGLMFNGGFIPELKQFTANNTLLAETLYFIDSQQLILEYQFPSKNLSNLYKAQLGLTHQELVFEPGRFFLAIPTGFQYHMRFLKNQLYLLIIKCRQQKSGASPQLIVRTACYIYVYCKIIDSQISIT